MKILLVEDEQGFIDFIEEGLQDEGHQVLICKDGLSGLKALMEKGPFDVAIVDIMMPKLDGLEMVKKARSKNIATPVLFLTAKDDLQSKVSGFESGGDDYLTKPFAFAELLARIGALSRRGQGHINEILERGKIKIDISAHKVFVNQLQIELTKTEFDLLEYLIRRAGTVVTRTQFLENIKGYHSDSTTNIVDVHIRSLRKKLGDESLIKTIRGLGYMIEA